jgi:hypothetical protein
MSDITREEQLARIARDITFSDEFVDLLDDVYSQEDRIAEFESDPKQFLVRHGFYIPGGIVVVIHDPGTIGRPARVDLHWRESIKPAPSEMQSSMAQELRRLARIAWDTLHSREMRQLIDVVQTSPEALRLFTSNPREYAATHRVHIPNELEVIVHVDDSGEVRVDLHFKTSEFKTSGPDGELRPSVRRMSECGCCWYDPQTGGYGYYAC